MTALGWRKALAPVFFCDRLVECLRLLITLRLNPAKMPLISYRENGFLQETRFLWGFLREASPSHRRLKG